MATDQQIRTSLERAKKSYQLRPGTARGTMKSRVWLEQGLRCNSEHGDWSFAVDEPTSVGGENSAPSPGVYALGALGACLSMTIKNYAVLGGLTIDAIEIVVEADYDDRGTYELDGKAPGFEKFRLSVSVKSPDSKAQIDAVVSKAMTMSSWFNVFSRPQDVEVKVMVSSSAENSDAELN